MDVDLLRPGTVPISPETVLWFEFLLDKDLLLKHLQKPSPDPTPLELLGKFLDAAVETLKNRPEPEIGGAVNIDLSAEKASHPAKYIALKILALKIAAYIKWDLAQIRLLPFKTQLSLIQDLLFFTNNRTPIEIPKVENVEISKAESPYVFALVMYHRWMLNVTMHRITSNWQARVGSTDISLLEEAVICTPENVQNTVNFLTDVLSWEDKIPGMLTFDCLKIPSEDQENEELDLEHTVPLTKEELRAQINYELGTFFFYEENYKLAYEHFVKCKENIINIPNRSDDHIGFANFDREIMEVYLDACSPQEGHKGSLLEQLNNSVVNHYMGITTILQHDNLAREIPITTRIILELDIQGAISSGTFTVAKDLLLKVRALNIVRCILDGKPLYHCSISTSKDIEMLLWALQVNWGSLTDEDKRKVKKYFIKFLIKGDIPEMLNLIQSNSTFSNFLTDSELQFIQRAEETVEIPTDLETSDFIIFDFSKHKNPKLQLNQLKQQLIGTYDHKLIRDLLVKIVAMNSGVTVWTMNPLWELPIPLQSVLQSLPRGFLQDFSFVMLAKARDQMLSKNWETSLELLIILDKEMQNGNGNLAKLSQMIKWEIILVQIGQLLDEWSKNSIDRTALANACEACLQSNESVLPRTEIAEQCVICLLNLGRWDFLVSFEKRWASFEICSAIALTCQDIVKSKGLKKVSTNLWDLVIPMFVTPPPQSKRSSSASSSIYHDSQLTNLKSNIMSVFMKLRLNMTFAVVISLLARLLNILKDDTSIALQTEYMVLWPAVVTNTQSYNAKYVGEVLLQIVTQALKYYPTNIPWLRLVADLNFANGHYKESLKFFLESMVVQTEYFNLPIRNDNHMFKRMIKCCTALGCYTQAAVLCQFLDEPDYTLAFRILGDQKSCNDAVDAYYHCFWDINILEYLIHMHNKRGEFQRRKTAIQIMGLLELNSSNNEEIQREAGNLRKSTFLRAMCKQYLLKED